jgi:thioredoxin 1
MACICIGGICIPYTALLPMLLIGLRWIASQFARVGLLPEFVARRLGLSMTTNANGGGQLCNEVGRGCCGNDEGMKRSVAPSSSSSSSLDRNDGGVDGGGGGGVEHVDDLSRWESIFSSHSTHESNSLFVKFTADWCKPCKSIHPAYASLSHSRHGPSRKFVTVDVDGDGCDVISGRYRIGMLPTFVYFSGGMEGGRMSGGHDEDGLIDWVDEMLSH